jgi:hypothetical protein
MKEDPGITPVKDASAEIGITLDQEKCTKRFARIAERNVKSLSSQATMLVATQDLFIAEIATRTTKNTKFSNNLV